MLSINNLCKTYKNFKLNNINLELKKGEVMGFIGANGAGKSTTIKSIINLVPIDSGQIFVDGLDNIKNEINVKQITGYVGELNLYNDVTAHNIYKFVKKFYFDWDDKLYSTLLKKFNIDTTKKIKELSRGTGVKFLLTLAISHHPKLLLLDEPTAGLDPIVRDELLNVLIKLVSDEQCTILFSSHITEDIYQIANKITYIHDGKISLNDDKTNIVEKYKKIEFNQPEPILAKDTMFLKGNIALVSDINKFKEIYRKQLNWDGIKITNVTLNEILLLLVN